MWGALIGFLFLNPLLGIVAGAGLGAATGEVGDFGISHRFMNELATHLKPGSSALFIPLKKEAVDETLRALGNSDGVVLSTDLKLEDEYQMEKLFEEMTAERAKKTSLSPAYLSKPDAVTVGALPTVNTSGFFMLHKIIVCCLVVVALAFPARASSLWHPEPGFLPEDAGTPVPNNPAPPERTVPEQVLPPLPVQDEGTIRRVATRKKWRP